MLGEVVILEEAIIREEAPIEDPFSYNSVLTPTLFNTPPSKLTTLS